MRREYLFLVAANPHWSLAAIAAVAVVIGGFLLFRARRLTRERPGRAGTNLLAGGLLVVLGLAVFAYSIDLSDNLGA